MDTFKKYWWVFNHPKLNKAVGNVTIELTPHKVNPLTKEIEVNRELNTEINWWIELSHPTEDDVYYQHAWELDCGGVTIDEAIDELYKLTLKKYGDYDND